ncbi:MAG: flagellar hook-associated protein FlgK [Acidobacteriia bacterium]|nr:flagellar hook-associated protein FlgK [Methyloceanibacter sp.]MCL6492502.1 flagellar hook-associated protein FlgK [Terriglobia bacterium]
MGLDSALAIASGGLANVAAQLALVSHNVANASTADFAPETLPQWSLSAGGMGMGVFTGEAQRTINLALQAETFSQNGVVSALQTRSNALQQIDAVLGSPGQSNDLQSLLTNLQNQFTALAANPASATGQAQVVASAQALAQGINALANAYNTGRQNAENDLVNAIGRLNASLATIGSLNQQIVAAQAQGLSTADLQNQRDQAMHTVSQLIGAKFIPQSNGAVLVATQSGLVLPTDGSATLSTTPATIGPASAPGSGIPPILLGGIDVTQQLTGGEIGADITLRDSTLPTYQAELDEFAQNLAGRFNAEGLPLFTDAGGNIPAGGGSPVQAGYVGFAQEITVNPAVLANPAAVRDGIPSQNTTGQAGFSTLINNILTNTFGAGTPPATNVSGLGPLGTLSAPFAQPATLGEFATDIVSSQSADAASAQNSLTTEQAVQTHLQSNMPSVNIDSEMSQLVELQNAYAANARIIAATQQMWNTLQNAVP